MIPIYEAFPDWAPELIAIVKSAGRRILEIRDGGLNVKHKRDDSPVTEADLASEAILTAGLAGLARGVPIISEEKALPDYDQRRQWPAVWLVDPLDGTREFVEGRSEFTVNIAYIAEGKPVLGLIFQPVGEQVVIAYRAGPDARDWVCYSLSATGVRSDLTALENPPAGTDSAEPSTLRVVVSRHYGDRDIQFLPEKLKQCHGRIEQIQTGSAVKFCLLATAKADFYVREAPTYEWDTAAGQAILEAVGGGICDFFGRPFHYNARETLKNEGFYAFSSRLVDKCWL